MHFMRDYNMTLFQTLSRLEQTEILASLPFEHSYTALNKMATATDQAAFITGYFENLLDTYDLVADATETELQINLNSHFSIHYPWLLKAFTQFRAMNKKDDKQNNLLEFLREKISNFIPTEHAEYTESTTSFEKKYPSSSEQKLSGLFAHHFFPIDVTTESVGLIVTNTPCAASPKITDYETENNNRQVSMLQMIRDQEVKHIIAIGSLSDSKQLNYANYCSSGIKSELIDSTLRVISEDISIHEASFTQLNVGDEKNLRLNFTELQTILTFHKHYQSEKVLVHCPDGVGKSAQINLLFALLDQMAINETLKTACDNLIESQINGSNDTSATKKHIKSIFSVIKTTLTSLRKIRVSIETQNQFVDTVTHLLSLRALQCNYSEQDIEKLIESVGYFSLPAESKSLAQNEMIELRHLTQFRNAPERKMVRFFGDALFCKNGRRGKEYTETFRAKLLKHTDQVRNA